MGYLLRILRKRQQHSVARRTKITTTDQLIRKLEARKEALDSNPRSLEILEEALVKATTLARLKQIRQTNHGFTFGLKSDQA